MKDHITKYIFILFVIGIIGFAFYRVYITGNTVIGKKQSDLLSQEKIIKNIQLGISEFDTINPILSQNRDVINLLTLLYEPLITITENYDFELCLAKECSQINDKTYIVKLKDNIKWEDNTDITAQDVLFTIEKLKNGNNIYVENVSNISYAEVIDNKTIKINLKEKQNFFEYNLIFPIISSVQFENENDFYNSKILPKASGKYKIKNLNEESMELVQNNAWYNAENVDITITDIKVNFYDSMGDIYNNFRIGNIDMLCTSNTKVNDYISTVGLTTRDYKGRELDFISLNCNNSVLSHKEVRQAIDYAIDKDAIISLLFDDEAYISNFPIDYGSFLYEKESTSKYSQEQAKLVLENAGWKYENGLWQRKEDGKSISINLNLVVNITNEKRVEVAKNIKQQLESIGIIVSVYEVSNDTYQNYLENKNYDMILTGIYNGYSPSLTYFFGENNIANYKNSDIENILNELDIIKEKNLLKEKYNDIIKIFEEDVPYICLYRDKGKVIYSKNLIGEFSPNQYSYYYHFEKWYKQQ